MRLSLVHINYVISEIFDLKFKSFIQPCVCVNTCPSLICISCNIMLPWWIRNKTWFSVSHSIVVTATPFHIRVYSKSFLEISNRVFSRNTVEHLIIPEVQETASSWCAFSWYTSIVCSWKIYTHLWAYARCYKAILLWCACRRAHVVLFLYQILITFMKGNDAIYVS